MSAAHDSPDAAPPPSPVLPVLPVRPAPLPGAPTPHAPEEPTVTVTFALEPCDLNAFQNHALKRGETWRVLFFLAALVVTANALPQLIRQLVDRPAPQFDIMDALSTYALPVTVLFSSYFSFLTQQHSRKGHDQTGRYEPRTIGLSQTYLHSADKQGDGRVRWNAVKTVDRGKQHTFISLTNTTGHVIPDRAFADDTQALTFYEQTVAYWRAATNAL